MGAVGTTKIKLSGRSRYYSNNKNCRTNTAVFGIKILSISVILHGIQCHAIEKFIVKTYLWPSINKIGSRTKCHRTKCHGQNVADKMLWGQNVIGQNVVDMMSWSKCRGQNCVVKMSWTKCRGQNVVVTMSWSNCRGLENVSSFYILVFASRHTTHCGLGLHQSRSSNISICILGMTLISSVVVRGMTV